MKKFLRKNRKKVVVLALGILFLLINLIVSQRKKGEGKTATVQKGEVSQELSLSGEVKASRQAKLTFEGSGKLVWVGVKEGDVVFPGQALAKLDTTSLNADYQISRAYLREQEAILQKIHDEVKDHDEDETFSQKATRTSAEAAYDRAYETVIKAERALRGATLTAPFNGVVTSVTNSFPGINLLFSQPQIEIVDPKSLYFEALADQTEVVDLKIGQEAAMILDAFEEKEVKGKIEYLSLVPKEGETGSVYQVKVAISEKDLPLRVGLSGEAKFVLATRKNVFYLPPAFVKSDRSGKYIKLGDRQNKTYIETGLEGEERVEIIGDFQEGQVVYD